MKTCRRLTALLALAAAAAALTGCAGEGMAFADVEPDLKGSCVMCHSSEGIDPLLLSVNALADSAFTAENFPNTAFPAGLIKLTVAELRKNGEPPEDATFDPAIPQRKAWLLHEMHELAALLAEVTPPDFTSQKAFEAFSVLGEAGAWEGCEVVDKLDLGKDADPEGMPPQWAPKLLGLLNIDFEKIDLGGREGLQNYVDRLLPGGIAACVAGGEGS